MKLNYMIGKGLREQGFDMLAKRIIDDTKSLVDESGMAEYFDPIEGSPLGGKNFSWTAAIYLEMSSAEGSEQIISNLAL